MIGVKENNLARRYGLYCCYETAIGLCCLTTLWALAAGRINHFTLTKKPTECSTDSLGGRKRLHAGGAT